MTWLKKYVFPLWGELLIALLFLIVANNFLVRKDAVIDSDGRGYYEYLPATFIYHDLELNYLDTLESEFYDPQLTKTNFYPRLPNGKRFDKYFIGTAVMQLPFFAVAHQYAKASEKYVADGFSRPYQVSIRIATLFYTFFGLIFLRLLLNTYDVNRLWILFLQVGVVFCTSMMQYMHWDASYSHVYSFFLVAGFLYFARSFLLNGNRKPLFWTVFFLGMIFLVRPVNVLVILFIPVLAASHRELWNALKSVFTDHLKTTILSVFVVVLLYQLQCLVWYFQTGHWFFYAYGKETFVWSDPHFTDFLFSYRKGFFLWAPWFFVLLVCGVVFHIFRKAWYRLIWFLVAFTLLVYVLSCWWYWSYGGSLGARPMVEFYPALIAFAAPLFARKQGWLKGIPLLVTPVLAYVMIIQTFQYAKNILTFDGMTREGYWKIFLETDPMYEYYLWRTPIRLGGKKVSETAWEQHREMPPHSWIIFDTLALTQPSELNITTGQIVFLAPRYKGGEILQVDLLDEKDSLLSVHYVKLLHTIDEKRGKRFADYRFYIGKLLPERMKAVFQMRTDASPVTIDSMKIRFFTD